MGDSEKNSLTAAGDPDDCVDRQRPDRVKLAWGACGNSPCRCRSRQDARLESVRAQDAFERSGIYQALPRDHVFHSVDEAVRKLGK